MLKSDKILIYRIRLHFAAPLILFSILTIGNYSFLRYTIEGSVKTSLLSSLAHLRMILPLWPILYAFNLNLSLSLRILNHNRDVLALLICWLLSSAFSMNIESYLLYGTWSVLTFVAILLVISFNAILATTQKEFVFSVVEIVWLGNIVVFILILLSFVMKPSASGIYAMLYSSNSFWAYPLLIVGIVSSIKIRMGENRAKRTRLILTLVLGICLVAIYLSARRGPLLVLSFIIMLTYFPSKFPHIFLYVGFAVAVAFFFKPKNIIYNLPDSFMKYRLKRLAGLGRTQKETSYAARERIWNTYMQGFYENPILGTGQSGKLINENNSAKDGYFSPHNTFIGLLSERGLLGTGLLLVVITRSILLVKPGLRKIYLILFIPTIAINWVEYNLLPGQIFFLYSVMIWLLPRGLLLVHNQDRNTH